MPGPILLSSRSPPVQQRSRCPELRSESEATLRTPSSAYSHKEMSADPDNEGNNPNNAGMSSRQRLRWTHELHERFVNAVAQLGGPDTNKGEKREQGDLLSNLENTSGTQITEALKLQMEVQKRLHEQLEVQRQLQLRIEAQGKYLKKIIEEQQRLSGELAEAPGRADTDKTDPSTPVPSSEPPLQDNTTPGSNGHGLYNGLACSSDPFSSHHEPLTPDSGGLNRSPFGSPKRARRVKRHRGDDDGVTGHPDTHPIMDTNAGPGFHHPSLMFPGGSHFDDDDHFGNRFRSDL